MKMIDMVDSQALPGKLLHFYFLHFILLECRLFSLLPPAYSIISLISKKNSIHTFKKQNILQYFSVKSYKPNRMSRYYSKILRKPWKFIKICQKIIFRQKHITPTTLSYILLKLLKKKGKSVRTRQLGPFR